MKQRFGTIIVDFNTSLDSGRKKHLREKHPLRVKSFNKSGRGYNTSDSTNNLPTDARVVVIS